MSTKVAISAILLLFCCSAWTSAQTEDSGTEEQTVRSLDDQERVAVLKQDQPALERLWSDQFTVNAPSNRVVIGKRAVLALVQRGALQRSSFERKIEFIHVDGGFCIIMGAETVQPIGDAPLAGQTVQRRFTNIWRKEAGTWRMIARHANVIGSR